MKIGILGASGRMGQLLTREVAATDGAILAAAIVSPQSKVLGAKVENLTYTSDTEAAFATCDVLIDFALPATTTHHVTLAARHKKPLVIGTTGFHAAAQHDIDAAAQIIPVLQSANMSVGVTLLSALVEQAAARLGEDFDIEIFEAHHRHKADAPSGTALLLAHAAAKGRKVDPSTHISPPYHGHSLREKGRIGMSVVRAGDIVGEHTVTFGGMGERVELTHKASDRAIFARGAVRAAMWLRDQKPGKYSLRDFLAI